MICWKLPQTWNFAVKFSNFTINIILVSIFQYKGHIFPKLLLLCQLIEDKSCIIVNRVRRRTVSILGLHLLIYMYVQRVRIYDWSPVRRALQRVYAACGRARFGREHRTLSERNEGRRAHCELCSQQNQTTKATCWTHCDECSLQSRLGLSNDDAFEIWTFVQSCFLSLLIVVFSKLNANFFSRQLINLTVSCTSVQF